MWTCDVYIILEKEKMFANVVWCNKVKCKQHVDTNISFFPLLVYIEIYTFTHINLYLVGKEI